MSEDSGDEFRFDEFLEENSRLITLLGVFGAISVYFNQYPDSTNQLLQNLGFVTSLIIFIAIASAIAGRINDSLNQNLFEFLVIPQWESYKLLLFVVPFYVLIFAVISIVLSQGTAVIVVIQALAVFFGASVFFWLVARGVSFAFRNVDTQGKMVLGKDERVSLIAKSILPLSLLCVIVAVSGIAFLENYGYGWEQLFNFELASGYAAVASGFLLGALAVAILYLFVVSLLFLSHLIAKWLIKKGVYEDFKEIYEGMQEEESNEEQTEITDFEDS